MENVAVATAGPQQQQQQQQQQQEQQLNATREEKGEEKLALNATAAKNGDDDGVIHEVAEKLGVARGEGEKEKEEAKTPAQKTSPPIIAEPPLKSRSSEPEANETAATTTTTTKPNDIVEEGKETKKTKTQFAINSKVSAKASFDGHLHPGTVVEIQRRSAKKKGDDVQKEEEEEIEKYYIHYEKFDKRLDEWVSAENVRDYTAAMGDGLFDESEAQNGIASANKMTSANGATNTNGESTPHSTTNPFLSSNNRNSHSEETTTRKLTRTMKRRYNEIHNVDGVSVEDLPRIDQLAEKEHEEKTKMKNIQCVQFGKYEMDAWYYSPYPEINGQCDMLYVCPYCMKYMRKQKTMQKHREECTFTHPPGKKIYEHENANDEQTTICFWEIDGKEAKTYCQNLCLVAKLFLDHKTLYYDVEPFNFYVMTECNSSSSDAHFRNSGGEKDAEKDNRVHVPVGYFSKEKHSAEEYNLACILTLPSHQRRGYGSFLISMSYELSKREGKFGTPERPLSDLGRVSYRSYWSKHILEAMRGHKSMNGLTIRDLSMKTMFRESDVTSALQSLNLLKYWKGQHIVSATPKIVETHLQSFRKTTTTNRSNLRFEPSFVNWQPPAASEPLNNKKK